MRNMMNSSRLSMVMAVALGILATTAATPALALAEPISVKNVSVSGGVVQVTVKNVSLFPVVTSLTVEAVVGGLSSFSVVPVVLLPGQSTVVSAAFTGAVSSVKSVGCALAAADMTDDPTPM